MPLTVPTGSSFQGVIGSHVALAANPLVAPNGTRADLPTTDEAPRARPRTVAARPPTTDFGVKMLPSRAEPTGRTAVLSGVEIHGSGSGTENEPRQATTRKRRSFRQHELLIGMVLLSAAFVFGSSSVASGLRSRNELPQTHQVTVTGSAQQAVTADTFEWDATVATTQPTTSAALAQINGWTAQIRTALVDAGAHDDEITFGSLQVQPNGQQTGAGPTFTESETITVRSSRLPAMEGVSGAGIQLLASNVPFIAQEPKYTFSGLKQLRPVLTAEASADARGRARAASGGAGRLGKLLSISVGQISVDSPGSVNIGSGDFNTGSIQQVVSVAVFATYSIPS